VGVLLVAAGVLFWLFVGHLIATAFRAARRTSRTSDAVHDSSDASGADGAEEVRVPVPPAQPAAGVPSARPADRPEVLTSSAVAKTDAELRRREEDVSFAVQRAVGATAEAYRDRLRAILERNDGPGWFEEFNNRRIRDVLAKGQPAPRPYRAFEPRAVLSCLAHDRHALQLIPRNVMDAAAELLRLSNAAHHLDADRPLAEGDARRAWRLYSEITLRPPPADAVDDS
jgi:hypothetical protein